MKLLFISGPSGSGKTTLSNQILARIKNGIVLRTDNYYKTGIISKLISIFVKGYFDRSISFDCKLFKKDFNFIVQNGISINERSYNFKDKTKINFSNKINNIKFLIVEGIFAREFSSTIYRQKIFLLELKINKNECMNRVLQRDLKERGKAKKKALTDFLRSWDIYYKNFKNKSIKRNINEIIIKKNTSIDKIIKNYLTESFKLNR